MTKTEKEMNNVETKEVKKVDNQPVTWSDAKIFLNSGKAGYAFIGVVVIFFILLLSMVFLPIPSYVYLILLLVVSPFIYMYYLNIHKDDESKMD